MHLSGNLIEYRKKLLTKIGPLRLQKLDVRRHNKMKLTPFDVEILINEYKAKVKGLEHKTISL